MSDFDDDDEAEAVAALKRGRTKKHATPERDLQRLIKEVRQADFGRITSEMKSLLVS